MTRDLTPIKAAVKSLPCPVNINATHLPLAAAVASLPSFAVSQVTEPNIELVAQSAEH
jgi:hypothetical protein